MCPMYIAEDLHCHCSISSVQIKQLSGFRVIAANCLIFALDNDATEILDENYPRFPMFAFTRTLLPALLIASRHSDLSRLLSNIFSNHQNWQTLTDFDFSTKSKIDK